MPEQNIEDLLKEFETLFTELKKEDPEFDAIVCSRKILERSYTGYEKEVQKYHPPWIVDEADPLVKRSLKALRSIGQNPQINYWKFGTDGSMTAGLLSIPTIGYSGAEEDYAHTPEERVNIDMIINLSTGAGARFLPDDNDPVGFGVGSNLCGPQKRVEHVLRLKPELCSLDVGSMNFGDRVFVNTVSQVETMADLILEAGIKPELEVFDMGHIEIAKHLLATGKVRHPSLFQLWIHSVWQPPI